MSGDPQADFHARMARLAARLNAQPENRLEPRPEPRPGATNRAARPATGPATGRGLFDENERTRLAYEAAVAGVQTGFPHLAVEDIAFPPKGWFDAALARQVALHLTIKRLEISKRRLAAELGRNRGLLASGLAKVEERLADPHFRAAYEAMAAAAQANAQAGDKP